MLDVVGSDQTHLARWAEKLGFEMIAVSEHHIIPRKHVDLSAPFYFHAYTAMAYFEGATDKVRVNSAIAILPSRNPIVTAKALATMDWMPSGRVTITFTVGRLEEEFSLLDVLGHERGVMIALWTEDDRCSKANTSPSATWLSHPDRCSRRIYPYGSAGTPMRCSGAPHVMAKAGGPS